MRRFLTLFGKEAKALFTSPIAYVVIATFLLIMGYTFTARLFITQRASLIPDFFQASVLLLLIVPVITMRLFAEERRSGTFELLLTSPVREIEVVLAKYLASLSMVVIMIALTLPYAVVLTMYGEPDMGPIYTGYLGLLLLGSALVALGLLISALTTYQIVAATVALGLFLLMWMLDTLGAFLPAPFDHLILHFSLLAHFTPFASGAIYLTDLGFFLTVILFGVLLSVRALVRR